MRTTISAPNNSKGFDHSDYRLNLTQAKSYVAKGLKFCIRYIPNPLYDANNNLTKSEADQILESGLWLGVCQRPCKATESSSWVPTPQMGEEWGASAAKISTEVGLSPGTTVWVDLEGVQAGTPSSHIVGFCNQWFDQVNKAGFEAGVYVGFDSILTPEQLDSWLTTRHFWRDQNQQEIPRKYQLRQLVETSFGVEFDSVTAIIDNYGVSATFTAN